MSLFHASKGRTSGEGGTSGMRRIGPVLLLVGVVPLALAACGSTSASGSSTSTTKPGAASEAAYTACLKQHGVTLPTFTPGSFPTGGTRPTFTPGSGGFGAGGGLRNNPKFEAAATACKSLRPSGGFGGFGRGSGGFNSAAFAAYRNCLKLHGVTLPTGRPPNSGTGSTPSTTTPSASYQAAIAACAALRPSASTTTTAAP